MKTQKHPNMRYARIAGEDLVIDGKTGRLYQGAFFFFKPEGTAKGDEYIDIRAPKPPKADAKALQAENAKLKAELAKKDAEAKKDTPK